MHTKIPFDEKILTYIEDGTIQPSPKNDGKYICPNCGKNDLSVSPSGAYKCFSGDCSSEEIRLALDEITGNTLEKRVVSTYVKSNPVKQSVQSPQESKLTNLPSIDLTRFPSEYEVNHPKKPQEPDGTVETIYRYSETQWIKRSNSPDGEKTFRYHHIDENGDTQKKKGDKPFPLYGLNEAEQFAKGKWVLGVEGEKCVEAARSIGLVSCTLAGGSWGKSTIKIALEPLKASGIAGIAFLEDNDNEGKIKGEKIKAVANEIGLPCITISTQEIWQDCPNKGDIADLLTVNRTMNNEEFIKSLERQFNKALTLDLSEAKTEVESEPKEVKVKIPKADIVGDELAEKYQDKLAYNETIKAWMQYSHGIWKPLTDIGIQSFVKKCLRATGIKGYGSNSYLINIISSMAQDLAVSDWKSESTPDLIPFKNGVLNLQTKKFTSHSPDHRLLWMLPRNYNPDAKGFPKIKSFLDFATEGNGTYQKIVECHMAATLRGGYGNLHKYLHLLGQGGTGKSTLERLYIDLIGKENSYSTTLHRWCNNRFESANAYGKKLLTFPDEDKGARSIDAFLQVTGGNQLTYERKGKDPLNFEFDGTTLLVSNKPVFAGDAVSRVHRREIVVPFNRRPNPSEIRDLRKEFEEELPAFTNHLLSISDQTIRDTLRSANQDIGSSLAALKARMDNDPISAWINDCLIQGGTAPIGNDKNEAEDRTDGKATTLYGHYARYCKMAGNTPKSLRVFSADLKETLSVVFKIDVEKKRNNAGRFFSGIQLRDELKDENIPTFEEQLEAQVSSAGLSAGLVSDKVSGSNPCSKRIVLGVSDKTNSLGEEVLEKSSSLSFSQEKDFSENKKEINDVYPTHPTQPCPVRASASTVPDIDPTSDPTPSFSGEILPKKAYKKGDRVICLKNSSYEQGSVTKIDDKGIWISIHGEEKCFLPASVQKIDHPLDLSQFSVGCRVFCTDGKDSDRYGVIERIDDEDNEIRVRFDGDTCLSVLSHLNLRIV